MTIELYKATLAVGGREVFRNLSFLAGPGERVAITGGVEGDGTLVLQALLGMRRLDSGWACVGGEAIQRSLAAYFRRSMAYLPKQFGFGSATLEEVAQMLSGERRNKGVAYSADDVKRAIEQLGVSGSCLVQPFSQLSAATAQRAVMALTLMPSRQVALLDSPTLFQDVEGRRLVAEYITSAKFNNVAMVIATNDAGIISMCDRVVELGK